MQMFKMPVSFVFALHMIKIWNRKNRNQQWTTAFIKKPTETDRKSENGNHQSTINIYF